ncbi:15152_t:CDS:2, partial [Gigaspora margarita]
FKKQKQCLVCRVKIHAAPVLSLTIKDTIDHFIRIKSSDKEVRLQKKEKEFKAISNPWGTFFDKSFTETKKKSSNAEIEDDTDIEIDDTGIEIDDTDIEIEDTDDMEDEDYLLDDSYDTLDSFIDDKEIDYTKITEDEMNMNDI